MLENLPKQTLWIGAAVVLFVVFVVLRSVIDAGTASATPAQDFYNELTAALLETGLLPTGSADTIVLRAAKVTPPNESFGEHSGTGGGIERIALGPAFLLVTGSGQPRELKVYPGEWRSITNGRLRRVLRELHGMDAARQRGGSQPGALGTTAPTNPNFSFYSMAESTNYRLTPFFRGGDCTEIQIRPE